ncbi:hypothetical protein, partial [Actinomadura sp. HBU206391]|uniref:hypothetical protein n=1 Tax=Actinomadura sp. HBU206391 TaxID=2731692 RepID=UPI001C9CC050
MAPELGQPVNGQRPGYSGRCQNADDSRAPRVMGQPARAFSSPAGQPLNDEAEQLEKRFQFPLSIPFRPPG